MNDKLYEACGPTWGEIEDRIEHQEATQGMQTSFDHDQLMQSLADEITLKQVKANRKSNKDAPVRRLRPKYVTKTQKQIFE